MHSDKSKCGLLLVTLYGCRDAGFNFEMKVFKLSTEGGATRGVFNPCCYFIEQRQISYLHHGDDFVIVARRAQAEWFEKHIGGYLITKNRGVLGPRASDAKSITILHRILRWRDPTLDSPTALEYQADPRHVELIVAQLGLKGGSRVVSTPSVKVPVSPDMMMPLPEAVVGHFRSVRMRASYLALDRPDIQFAAKEAARGMSAPLVRHQEMLKRLGRYLLGAPMMVWCWRNQRWPGLVVSHSDTDWAGCLVTRKSTSGTAITWGTHTWLTLSSTQVPISLSSTEAELYGVVKASSRGLGIVSIAKDLGFASHGPTCLDVNTDSSGAKGVCVRRGAGKLRHVDTGAFWIQDVVAKKRLRLNKVPGKTNVADIFTKAIDAQSLIKHLKTLRMRVSKDRLKDIPKALLK